MLDDVKFALAAQGITKVAIVDDVFDAEPRLDDVPSGAWDVLLDDLEAPEHQLIAEGTGHKALDEAWGALERVEREKVLAFLWQNRAASPVFDRLFEQFVKESESGRRVLEPLRQLLGCELQLEVHSYGRHGGGEDADLVFLDLFLGVSQDEAARNNAVARIVELVRPREGCPPLVVLMSSSPRLGEMRDMFRDEAGLLGCQFRVLHKSEIGATDKVLDIVYRLVSRYRDTLYLSKFLDAWRGALEVATKEFLRRVRRLDLRDYADIQTLVLDAEKEELGAHLLEVYDRFFHSLLEGDRDLHAAGKAINGVAWKEYPPPHFLPAHEATEILDGLLYHHERSIEKTDPVGLGDVLIVQLEPLAARKETPPIHVDRGELRCLVVLTQACDLQHGDVSRVLFLGGVARPSEVALHKKPDASVTPVLVVDGKPYVLEWDFTAPISCTPDELADRLGLGTYRRVRRLRTIYALQLQQRFASELTRVGTMVTVPMQHYTGLSVFYRHRDGDLILLDSIDPTRRQAMVVVGRDEKVVVDRLVLAPELVDRVREKLREVPTDAIAANVTQKWQNIVGKRSFFTALENGVSIKRDGRKRPLSDVEVDVFGPYTEEDKRPMPGKPPEGATGLLLLSVWPPSVEHNAAPRGDGAMGSPDARVEEKIE